MRRILLEEAIYIDKDMSLAEAHQPEAMEQAEAEIEAEHQESAAVDTMPERDLQHQRRCVPVELPEVFTNRGE